MLRALAFLSYREALMAGSWQFLGYFGRDTLLSVRLLMPAAHPELIEAGLGSVIDRLASDGRVAHYDESGEFVTLRHLTQKDGGGLRGARQQRRREDLLERERRPGAGCAARGGVLLRATHQLSHAERRHHTARVVVANPAYAGEALQKTFTSAHYHGTVVCELWSFAVQNGQIVFLPFGQARSHEDESNAAQLSSTVYLAVRPPRD